MSEIDYNTPISEVLPIALSCISAPADRAQLASIVEAPVREACLFLYDQNIQTRCSSGNAKDVARGGLIAVGYDSLSAENKRIAHELSAKHPQNYRISFESPLDKHRQLNIIVPISSPDETVGEISERAIEMVKPFKKQKCTWVTTLTIEDMLLCELTDPEEREAFIKETEARGYPYDREKGVFYLNQEQYDKAHEKIKPYFRILKRPKIRFNRVE